jgi:hypothetical protein
MHDFARGLGRIRGHLKVRHAMATASLRRRLRLACWIAAVWIFLTVVAAALRLAQPG